MLLIKYGKTILPYPVYEFVKILMNALGEYKFGKKMDKADYLIELKLEIN